LNRKHAAQIVGPITHDAGRSASRWLTIWVTAFGKSVHGWTTASRGRCSRWWNQEIVLLHGFIKKQQKTPQDELELAKKRKRQYLQNL
jgi:hypothetical protein